ncbi:hypothetical protein HYH03_018299 [Edaphochlamys debaryana]|uniref:Uncharacterized protein n=1 Tax=Edaphochlamys debaryana TaxID=47281 RepID=A0A835XMB5_9CHLO|nr:hypothetical protein HYH03_018299 [Edaphochlamys debaryana]|eukprot:KAG2482809.1 hypothetical protein HYH03_018299 [Edaphochlamys debaryana]
MTDPFSGPPAAGLATAVSSYDTAAPCSDPLARWALDKGIRPQIQPPGAGCDLATLWPTAAASVCAWSSASIACDPAITFIPGGASYQFLSRILIPETCYTFFGSPRITPTVPTELGLVTSLKSLRWINGNVQGALPTSLGNLTNLQELDLSQNPALGGSLSALALLSALTRITLTNTPSLSGPIPTEWGSATNLVQIDLDSSAAGEAIGGVAPPGGQSLPDALSSLRSLQILNVAAAKLQGSLPPSYSAMTSLTKIHADQNSGLSGALPSEYSALTALQELWAGGRAGQLAPLTGTTFVPAAWAALTNLKSLRLEYTAHGGTLTPQLAACTALTEIKAVTPALTGSMPPEWSALQQLRLLSIDGLYGSTLTGSIPAQYFNSSPGLTQLTELRMQFMNLASARMSGSIPLNMSACRNLKALYLDNLGVTGTIPHDFIGLTGVTTLSLTMNQLQAGLQFIRFLPALLDLQLHDNPNLAGPLPPDWSTLTRLSAIDLTNTRSGVNASGAAQPLPSEWTALTGLSELKLSNIGYVGNLPDAWSGLTSVMSLDLSQNPGLVGTVPNVYTQLQFSLSTFNLAGTQLPEQEVVGSFEAWWTPKVCSGPPVNNPFRTIPTALLTDHGPLDEIAFLYDSVAPGVVVAVQMRYGTRVETAAGSLYLPGSPTLTERTVRLTSPSGTAPAAELTLCCDATTGAVAQLRVSYADGTSAETGACLPGAGQGTVVLQGPGAGPGGAVLGGMAGDAGAGIGGLAFASVSKTEPPPPGRRRPPPPTPPGTPSRPLAPRAPNGPNLPTRPPSPPPPKPATPSRPPSTKPNAPPQPPPPPAPTIQHIETTWAAAVATEWPQIVQGVPPVLPNLKPAVALVVMGSGLPLAINDATNAALVATNTFSKGQIASFGGERMITECCKKGKRPQDQQRGRLLQGRRAKNGAGGSNPGMDELTVNVISWASKYGTKVGKAVLRVADRRFVDMAKYVVKQRPETFHTLKEAHAPSYYLSLQAFLKGGHHNCDVYVIPAYDTAYTLPEVQQSLTDFVTHGKGLIFVGPDVMPSAFYGDQAPAARRRSALGSGGSAWAAGAGDRRGGGTAAEGVGLHARGSRGGRTLSQEPTEPAADGQVIDPESVTANLISGPMGIHFSGFISDPGGNLTIATPTAGQNAELAAQQLILYLEGQMTLSAMELDQALTAVSVTRASVPRSFPSSASFYTLSDQLDTLQANRPAFPPLLSPPPPPLRNMPPPPAPRAPPSPWDPPPRLGLEQSTQTQRQRRLQGLYTVPPPSRLPPSPSGTLDRVPLPPQLEPSLLQPELFPPERPALPTLPPSPPLPTTEQLGAYTLSWSPLFCSGPRVHRPFRLISSSLLESYGPPTNVSFVYDTTSPGLVVAIRLHYGASVDTAGGALYVPGSRTQHERVLPLRSAAGAAPVAVRVCCQEGTGALANVELEFADGATSATAACSAGSGSHRRVLLQGPSGASGAAAVAPGAFVGGLRGDLGAGIGGLAIAGARGGAPGQSPRGRRRPPPAAGPAVTPSPQLPPQLMKAPRRPALRFSPPSPPPPEPLPPSPPPDKRPLLPPMPPQPPSPTGDKLLSDWRTSLANDWPLMVDGVPTALSNTRLAVALVVMGSGLPLVTNARRDALVGATNYGEGQVAALGGERLVTECCRAAGSRKADGHQEALPEETRTRRKRGGSDPGMDRLIVNVVAWAAKDGTKAGKAVLRVADARFVTMAKYVVKQRPETFRALKPARVSSFHLPLGLFLEEGHENCDVFVIPAYASAYTLPHVQQALREFVARGKGLIVVGPDVMPSTWYEQRPAARRRAALQVKARGQLAAGGGAAGAPRDGGTKQQPCALQQAPSGPGRWGDDFGLRGLGNLRRQAGGSGQPAPSALDQVSMGHAGHEILEAPRGLRTERRGLGGGASGQVAGAQRQLLQSEGPLNGQSFDSMLITVNLVSGPMGLLFTGFVSDPGGNLSVTPPTSIQNSELAAQRLIAHLRGQVDLSPKDLTLVIQVISTTRAAVPRTLPSTTLFWSLSDQLDSRLSTHTRLGVDLDTLPSLASPPPPPPDRTAPPPPGRTAPTSPSTLPASAAAVGCFAEALSARALMPVTLMPADRGNSVASCARAADRFNANLTLDGRVNGALVQAVIFVGLMRSSCLGSANMPPAVVLRSQMVKHARDQALSGEQAASSAGGAAGVAQQADEGAGTEGDEAEAVESGGEVDTPPGEGAAAPAAKERWHRGPKRDKDELGPRRQPSVIEQLSSTACVWRLLKLRIRPRPPIPTQSGVPKQHGCWGSGWR